MAIPILLSSWINIVLAGVMSTAVLLRAGRSRAARLFVAFVSLLTALSLSGLVRAQPLNAPSAYLLSAFSTLILGLMSIALLLLIGALFIPQWWERRPGRARPIQWIVTPFILVMAFVVFDLLAGARLAIGGLEQVEGMYRLERLQPGAAILISLFGLSWLVHIGALAGAYWREPDTRRPIGIMLVSLIVSVVFGSIRSVIALGGLTPVFSALQALPVLIALAYATTRGGVFEPTRAAINLALEAMSEAVAFVDLRQAIAYVNHPAQRLGLAPGQAALDGLRGLGATPAQLQTLSAYLAAAPGAPFNALLADRQTSRQLELTLAPVTDERGRHQGILLLGRDITAVAERTAQLGRERQRLAQIVATLEAEQAERAHLAVTVRALSLPLIPVLDGVLVLPLIGVFDGERVADFLEVLLKGIERERARQVLLDVTGVELLDSAGARGLLRGVRAARLLGADCTLVGARPEIAQALVAQSLTLEQLASAATVQSAVRQALRG